jgi:hypothetical protein
MTPQQIVALALRLFAIWLGTQALRMVPWYFEPGALQSPSHVYNTFVLAISAVLIVALGLFPRSIAGKLLPSSESQSRISASADTWLAMGCTLIGLWTLTTTFPRLVYDTIALSSMPHSQDHSYLTHWVIYNVIELLIAVWLILGGKGVRKLFWWAQNAGIGNGR